MRSIEEMDEERMQKTLSIYKDQWYFDLGYHIAFTQIIYCTVLIFSSVAPIITPFGCCFFTIKYFIDKYNILHLYPPEFQGVGRLSNYILGLKYFAIGFSQVIMFGILIVIFGQEYIIACIFIVVLQLFALVLSKLIDFLPMDRFKAWLASDFMSEQEEDELKKQKEERIIELKEKLNNAQ